jgi:GR25 family glycosyltransferase involved in LPS biosynthesis
MKTLVINLESRSDRLKLFMDHWVVYGPIERVDGVVSDIPHTGCGLAHINAIRIGLKDNDWCLILEDDARLVCSVGKFKLIIEEAIKHECDAVFLGANVDLLFPDPESVHIMSPNFMKVSRTKSLRSCTAMLWSRRSLPLINEFERILKSGYVFPIDRMLTSFAYPWIVTRYTGDESPASKLIEPLPNVLICKKCLVIQEVGLFSDNTFDLSEDVSKGTVEYLDSLYEVGSGRTKPSVTISVP